MKKHLLLAVVCIALFLCSCQKEELNSRSLDNSGKDLGATSSSQKPSLLSRIKNTEYGALIDAPNGRTSLEFQVNVAKQLGISCLRSRVIVPGSGIPSILNTGYKVLLNFNSDYEGKPLPFVSNLKQYQTELKNTVARFHVKPVVAVIENEESNKMYHTGTAQEYIKQLNAAIDVMHAYGIKVANGGITDNGLNYLVYKDFINQGKYDSAEQFRILTHVTPRNPATQNRGAFVDILLQAYAQMDLDYVNFHWKGTSSDTQALMQVIAYLKKVTGKPVISNEMGQFDKDPSTLTSIMDVCTIEQMPYVLWYSPDENAGRRDTPLHHSDASLTSTGVAYQNYPKN